MSAPAPATGPCRHDDPLACAAAVAQTAAVHADDVDRDARFPAEAIAALRDHRLLAACAPRQAGGLAMPLADAARVVEILASGCSAAAMTWAMHQIQLACLARHGGNDYLRDYLAQACRQQLLLASATSEVGVGGDIRTSIAALVPDGTGHLAEKQASTISYGSHADAILATLRRSPDAAAGEQVMVLMQAPATTLEQLSTWDALGMRGTCSNGYRIRSQVDPGQVLPDPFEVIVAQTMVPYSHVLWAACWLGVAGDALGRARQLTRTRQRKDPGGAPATLLRLAHGYGRLDMARAMVAAAATAFDAADGHSDEHWQALLSVNNVKVAASETAIEVTTAALALCGFAGYQASGPYSVGRHLRDVLSAPMMVSNDRLLLTNGGLLVTRKDDPWPR